MIYNIFRFNNNETHIETKYIIARFEKTQWFHYLDCSNIDDAKMHLKNIRKLYPHMKLGIFEKTEQVTIHMLDEESI